MKITAIGCAFEHSEFSFQLNHLLFLLVGKQGAAAANPTKNR